MANKQRRLIVFDGEKWHVRRVRLIEHDLDHDEKVYRCDRPIGNDYDSLRDVPEVRSLLAEYTRELAREFNPRERRVASVLTLKMGKAWLEAKAREWKRGEKVGR